MATANLCPRCGTVLTAGAPERLCPRCLLLAGLDDGSQGERTSPYAAQMPFVPPGIKELGRLFTHLELIELLGQGGMGAVYKARQTALNRLVAIKILPPNMGSAGAFAERFTREAQALARLSHPNIVAVYDFGHVRVADSGTDAELFYFVMEYVEGANLRQLMRAGQLPPEEALKIVPQICDALQFAHDEGIVHRDIKPENILVDRRGRVKIADFGLAKLVGKDAAASFLTGTQQVMGTPQYMAPEQFEGTRDVDHRADIYSLGVTFYEMLTGELPLGRFAPPSGRAAIDVRLDEVVMRALEKAPEQRYQHASEIKTDVEFIAVQPAASPRQTSSSRPALDEKKLLLPEFRIDPAVQRSLRWAGAGMVVAGTLTLLSWGVVLGAVLYLLDSTERLSTSAKDIMSAISATQFFICLILGVLMIRGGAAARSVTLLSRARLAGIVALAPVTLAWPLTLPMGIWLLAVLRRPTISAAFEQHDRELAEEALRQRHRPLEESPWYALGQILGMVVRHGPSRNLWLIIAGLAGCALVFGLWEKVFVEVFLARGNVQASFDVSGEQLWQGLAVGGVFLALVCLAVVTYSIRQRVLWRGGVVAALAAVNLVVIIPFFVQPPVPEHSTGYVAAVRALRSAPNVGIDVRNPQLSDAQIIRLAARHGAASFAGRPMMNPYLALYLTIFCLMLGLVELQGAVSASPQTRS